MTNSDNMQVSEKLPIIMNWLGCEGLRFTKILTGNEQESTRKVQGYLRC